MPCGFIQGFFIELAQDWNEGKRNRNKNQKN